jgi:TonB family protein
MKKALLLLALAACAPAQPAASSAPAPGTEAPAGRARPYELSEVDTQPALLNREAVAAAIRANYPTLLRDAGVIGTATVRFVVGADGVPERSTIRAETSTHPDFGVAGERVAAAMRFSPATLGGAPVRVVLTLPISFSLR